MNVFLYMSEDFPHTGKINKVIKDLSYATFYFFQSDDTLIYIINQNDVNAKLFNKKDLYKVLKNVDYILVFYNSIDKTAIKIARYASCKTKNLIIIPCEINIIGDLVNE